LKRDFVPVKVSGGNDYKQKHMEKSIYVKKANGLTVLLVIKR